MNEADVLSLSRQAMMVALSISLPILLAGLVAGVLISIFQAATQIQEMTLSFVPKMLAVVAVISILGSWMLSRMVTFTTDSFTKAPPYIQR